MCGGWDGGSTLAATAAAGKGSTHNIIATARRSTMEHGRLRWRLHTSMHRRRQTELCSVDRRFGYLASALAVNLAFSCPALQFKDLLFKVQAQARCNLHVAV